MFRDFASSSHARGWMFASEAEVEARRQSTHESALEGLAQSGPADPSGGEPLPPPPPREDGAILCAYYEVKLQELCRDENARDPSRFTYRVLCTAQTYYKRFFLQVSPMEEEPRCVMLAALYLAGKVEEERIQLPDLVPKYAKLPPETLLALELRLMEVLRFQLCVRSPFRCLTGLLQDLHAGVVAGSAGQGTASADVLDELEQLHQRAIDLVCRTLCADAPFLHSPQQIALAALLHAAPQEDGATARTSVDVRGWIESRFGGAPATSTGSGGAAVAGAASTLTGQLVRVQRAASHCRFDLEAEGTKARLKAIDASLRRLTRHMKRVEKARREKRAAAELDLRQQQHKQSSQRAPEADEAEGAAAKRRRLADAEVTAVKREI